MNRIKTKITNELTISSLVPSIIDSTLPECVVTLDDYKEYSDYNIRVYFVKSNGSCDYNTPKVEMVNGKCVVPTKDVLCAKKMCYSIASKIICETVTLELDLTNIKRVEEVIMTEQARKYNVLLEDLIERIEDLDNRVKELEKDKEYEIL